MITLYSFEHAIYPYLTLLLMSTGPQWRRLVVSSQISHTSQKASRSNAVESTPDQIPNIFTRKLPPDTNCVQTPTVPYRNQIKISPKSLDVDNQNPGGAKSKRRPDDFHRNEACGSTRCPPGASEPFLKAPGIAVTQSGQSTLRNLPVQQKQTEEQLKFRHRRPHLTADPQETISNQAVTQESTHNQPVSKKKLTKLKRRSKTESLKTVQKPNAGKNQCSFPAKFRKRKKKKKISSKDSRSSSESSETSEKTGWAFKMTAAGQHGFMKNASTGSDSLESSFTVVNIDQADLIKDQGQKTTRVVGTSIQEFLTKRCDRYPLSSHRSVGIQADGSDKTPKDSKTLFQKLLPRISALSTKPKQTSINASGQSSYIDFSNSRSYHGSQSVQSCPERGCTTVEVQYAASGSVRAILRTSPSFPSKYSSRCSAIWSGDRLTPIIQGVSLSPSRTPPTENTPKTSKSDGSRAGPSRTRS